MINQNIIIYKLIPLYQILKEIEKDINLNVTLIVEERDLKKEITKCLSTYEGRIIIVKLACILDFDNNGYDIELEYMIVGRSDQPVAVDFFLSRTR